VSDIFQEIDEEVRRERLKQLWDRYGNFVVALAILFVLAIAGWRGYQWWEAKRAAESGAAFEAAAALEKEGKRAEAEAAYAKIAADGTSGYRTLARFSEAAQVAFGDRSAAARLYDALATDSGVTPVLQALAKVRAGLILVDSASFGDMQARLEPLTAPTGAFRHTARELLALSAWRSGDLAAARRFADMIMNDGETPGGIRARAEMLIAVAGEAKS
jgi:hypothetical protein